MSISINTGTMPYSSNGFTVVGNPAATEITSSPGCSALSSSFGEVRAANATRFADEPELVVSTWRGPINRARFFSNSSLKRPVVSQPSRQASTIETISLAPITFPDAGMGVSPGVKYAVCEYFSSAKPSTRARILLRMGSSMVRGSLHNC